MSRRLTFLLILVTGQALAQGDTILERRYVFDKLDTFWTATLGAQPPQTDWYAGLAAGDGALEPEVEVPTQPVFDVPFGGIVLGEDAASSDDELSQRAFPVVAVRGEHAPILYRRVALLELYLGRYSYFERTSQDSAEDLALLSARHSSAALELYLIHLLLYFADDTLERKCARLDRLTEVERGSLTAISETALLDDWQSLFATFTSARDRLDTGNLRTLVCSVSPVRSRGEMQQIVTTRVRERIAREVTDKVVDTLTLLGAASEEFQSLINDMDITIKSAEILELERVLGNVQANMLLVKEDQLRAQTTLAELQTVDLTRLNNPAENEEFAQAQATVNLMIAAINSVLVAQAALESMSSDDPRLAGLDSCQPLADLYPGLDLNLDSSVLQATVIEPYEACLDSARTVVENFQAINLQQMFMAELARHVKQISGAFVGVSN